MAGVPQIMQVMLDYVTPKLRTGAKMLSQSVRADCREGDIGTELGEIAAGHPGVVIGSYPFMDEQRGANTHVVVRARDAAETHRRSGGGRGDADAGEGGARGRAHRTLTAAYRPGAIVCS